MTSENAPSGNFITRQLLSISATLLVSWGLIACESQNEGVSSLINSKDQATTQAVSGESSSNTSSSDSSTDTATRDPAADVTASPSPAASPSPSPSASPSPSVVVIAPSSLSYSGSSVILTKDVAITPLSATLGAGSDVTFSVSPSLPAGLNFNTTTGLLSGTPTELKAVTVYTVTATNASGSTQATVSVTVIDSAPSALTYSAAGPYTFTKGSAITQLTPSNGGGLVVSYAVIGTALPAGLSLNTTTGVISGTPTGITALASYTVRATNTGGSTNSTLSVTVNDSAPTSLTYTNLNPTYVKNTAIIANVPSNTGGAATSYSIDGTLPTGLNFDTSTGIISGTPSSAGGPTVYTVTASNITGFATKAITIEVANSLVAPSTLSYSTLAATYTRGAAITTNSPTYSGGTPSSFSISATLPTGLSFNTSSGIISGTPNVIAGSATFTVTATNDAGSVTKDITVVVNDVAPSSLNYTAVTSSYTINTAIATNSPTSSGGAVVSYAVSPALPTGLSLDTSTGDITGTPTVLTPVATYTVTATNTGGSTTKALSITVKDVAPSALTYTTVTAVYTKDSTIASNTPSSAGGAVISYSVSSTLPTGLSFDTATGLITGTPTAITSIATYTVTATNSGGTTTKALSITVNDVAPSSLAYTRETATYTKDVAIATNSPSSSGGTVVSYSVSPALPTGLSLNTTTGAITGTPTVNTSSATYTITATNTGGFTTKGLSFTVSEILPTKLVLTGSATTTAAVCTAYTASTQDADSQELGVNASTVANVSDGAGSGSFYAVGDSTCAGSTITSVTFSTGQSSKLIYYKNTTAEAVTLTASRASGNTLTDGTKGVTVSAAAATQLAFSTQPPTTAQKNTSFTSSTVAQIRDAYGNVVTSNSSSTVILTPFTDNTCTTAASGTLANVTVTASSGVATFGTTALYTSTGTIYLKVSTGALTTACSTSVVVSLPASSSSQSLVETSSTYVPADGAATAIITVIPKDANGNLLGTGKTIEVTQSGTATWIESTTCRVNVSTCRRATDVGGGSYTVTAKIASTATITFSAVIADTGGDVSITDTAVVTFDSSKFATTLGKTVTAAGSITSADASGKNLYINVASGVITFDATTEGQTFGDVIIKSGTVKHAATIAGTINRLNITVSSLTLLGGSIDATGLGYTAGKSFAGTTPGTGLATTGSAGGSHGGMGGYTTVSTAVGPVFDDYRNPSYPGGSSGAYAGGGIIRIVSTNACSFNGVANILADGSSTAAGGSIYLRCGGFSSTGSGWTGVIRASGGATTSTYGAGGGGRVALVSTAGLGSFSGGLTYPVDSTTLTTFKSKVRAYGGAGSSSYGNGGAGTVYIKHSGQSNGALIVDNGTVVQYSNGGTTKLVSIEGTVNGTPGSNTLPISITSTMNPAVGTAYDNAFTELRIRPNTSSDNGTANDWSDDNVVTVLSNAYGTGEVLTTTANFTGVSQNNTFRSIDILDYIDIGGASILESNGDIYLLNGSLASPGGTSMSLSGITLFNGNAGMKYAAGGTNIDMTIGADISLAGKTLTGRNLTVNAGATVTASAVTITGNLDVSGTASSVTTTGTISAVDLSISGTSYVNAPTVSLSGNVSISSTSTAALITQSLTAVNYTQSAGTVKHTATTAATVYRLAMNLSGAFSMTGGNINVSALGYLTGYSYGPGSPTTALAGTGLAGGSHGGMGGYSGALSTTPGPAYGDYRNPNYPGGTAGYGTGGGVVRITASGNCGFTGAPYIYADGQSGAAGGSIYLNCGGFSTSSWTGLIRASGATNTSSYAAGGGGRVALISTGNAATFTGSLSYPTDSTTLTTFKARVKALGGATTNTAGNGGAGSVYIKHSGQTYGALIVDNGNVVQLANGGVTKLVSIAGTINGTPGSDTLPISITSSMNPAMGTAYNDLFTGLRIRPNTSFTNSTTDNWSDDNIVTVASNSSTTLTTSTSFTGVSQTHSFRSIDVLDYIDIGGGAITESNGDVYLLSGSLSNPGGTSMSLGGFYFFNGSAAMQYTAGGTNNDIAISADTDLTGRTLTGRNLTITGTSVGLVADAITLTGNFDLSGTTNTVTTTGAISAVDFAMAGSTTVTAPTLSLSGNFTMASSGTLTTQSITAVNFTQSAGVIAHVATTATVIYRLAVNLSGTFSQSGGKIDVSMKGYIGKGYGGSTPSTGLVFNLYGGASHGGMGGYNATASEVGPTYGDYRNPNYPGAGWSSYAGGGVVRITAASTCTFSSASATSGIYADGQSLSAGGSIYMNCAGFAGGTWAGFIRANGGAQTSTVGAGGGGRIALISTGTTSSFTGNLSYPAGASAQTILTTFKTKVIAKGGAGTSSYGNGGAGTIFIKASPQSYGALIVDNGNNTHYSNGGTTKLVSIAGTVTSTPGSDSLPVTITSTMNPAIGTAYNDYFTGMRVRPNTSFTNNTANNLSDDNVLTVSSNSATTLTMDSSFVGVSAGDSFRSIDILDFIDIGGNAVMESNGDVYLLSGSLSGPGLAYTALTGVYLFNGSAGMKTSTGDVFNDTTITNDINLTGKTLTGGNLTLSSGARLDVGAVNISGLLRVSGASTYLASTGTVTAASLSIGDTSLVNAPAVNVSGDVQISSSSTTALITQSITAANYSQSAGTVKHTATSATVVYRLEMNLSGTFSLSGGKIDVSSLGYKSTYSYGGSVPSTALQSTGGAGGSHGGQGGHVVAASAAGAIYDDYRNPNYPGGSGVSGGVGGGVVRVTAAGTCSFTGTSSTSGIYATGGTYAAGGSIYLNCGGFNMNSAFTGFIQANGGAYSSIAAGGGGRIALISSGNASTFAASPALLSYPSDSSTLTTFKARVRAYGGNGSGNYGNGAAGTIYVKHSAQDYGSLIIDNSGATLSTATYAGYTDFLSTTVNTNVLTSVSGDQKTAQIGSNGATLLTGLDNVYANHTLQVYASPLSAFNPMTASHTTVLLSGNDTNHFITTSGSFPAAINSDYVYRMTHHLDHLDVGGAAQVRMTGADLIMEYCDLHSASLTTFAVPAGATLTGNSMASPTCLNSSVATKGSTVTFTNYFLQ